jgi:hypothetical protein
VTEDSTGTAANKRLQPSALGALGKRRGSA